MAEPKKDKDGFKVPVRKIKRSKNNEEVIQSLGEKSETNKLAVLNSSVEAEVNDHKHST